ncbi:MAG: type II secretion system protein GspE, partial [Candidatus Bipolaricaulia bacterium]
MKDQLKTNFLKYLMRQDLLTEEQKTRVEKMFQEDEADLDRIIIRNNILKKDDYYQILAGYLSEEMSRDIMFYPLSPERLDEEIVRLIPESMARRHVIIPVGKENGRLKLAMADPSDLFATDDVAFRTGYEIEPVLGARDDILSSLAYVFGGMDESWDEVIGDLKGDLLQDIEEIEDQDVDLAEASKLAQEAPVLRLVNNIILQALKRKASDIHIEPLDRQ